ncbi:MAG: ABC transporter ATP-binding protein [bacterium]|nr:ABC transporter ATP-binding protein [bacterium]
MSILKESQPIRFSDATKKYGAVTALHGLHLTVERGECLVLLGQNGAGKSTALKMLMGLIEPSAGTVELFGENPANPAAREKVGYLPGELGWPLGVKCGEWLGFLADLSGKPDFTRRMLLLETLQFPISRLNSYIGTLSQGMKRKLGLVAAMEPRPELLVFDEPSDGLDPVQQRAVIDLLKRREPETTLLLSSHDLREAFELADRVAIFAQGKLVEQFAKPAVSSPDELEERFFAAVEVK